VASGRTFQHVWTDRVVLFLTGRRAVKPTAVSHPLPPAERAEILERIAPGNLFQPATVLWRVYEIEAVLQNVAFAGRILDLGCGDGTLSSVIFRRSSSCTLVGLEPDGTDAQAARRRDLYATVHWASGDSIPEPDGSFDMVFSNSVLEHIPKIEPVLREVGRVLRKDGCFVLTVPSEKFHACLSGLGPLPFLWRMRGQSVEECIDRRLQHHRYWSPEQWSEALRPLGFSAFQIHRYLPAQVVQAWEQLSNMTGGLLFELLGRRAETRRLQRRLSLAALESRTPPGVARAILRWVLAKHLAAPMEVDGQLSGGLLLTASKSSLP
jgi:SAM-dependent methyltransferase